MHTLLYWTLRILRIWLGLLPLLNRQMRKQSLRWEQGFAAKWLYQIDLGPR